MDTSSADTGCPGPGLTARPCVGTAAVPAMDKPVQWMKLLELRHELERARQAWQARDLVGVLADGELPAVSQDAHRHQLVATSCSGDRNLVPRARRCQTRLGAPEPVGRRRTALGVTGRSAVTLSGGW